MKPEYVTPKPLAAHDREDRHTTEKTGSTASCFLHLVAATGMDLGAKKLLSLHCETQQSGCQLPLQPVA